MKAGACLLRVRHVIRVGGERWDAAELALIKGLENRGFRDAFRARLEQREPSWVWQRWGGGHRLDHLIVSREVLVPVCGYLCTGGMTRVSLITRRWSRTYAGAARSRASE
jgi:hypothetical protein